MRLFLTDAAYQAAISDEVDQQVMTRMVGLINLYSENPELLRRTVAAHYGISDWTTIREDSTLLKYHAQGIRAFGQGMAAMRAARNGVPTYLVDGLGQE